MYTLGARKRQWLLWQPHLPLQRASALKALSLFTFLVTGGLFRVGIARAAEQSKGPILLVSGQIQVKIEARTGAIASVVNKLTGVQKSLRDVPFTVYTDRGIVTSERCRMVAASHNAHAAAFEYENGFLSFKLTYQMRASRTGFVEKLLTITNHSERSVDLDTLVLEQMAFNPPPLHIHSIGRLKEQAASL